ncbi:MAG: hypothetical protein IPK82_24195 [Polyangiaceae bacterium]|nr:hypothetical protein [Polyangiaceae bacterium]
MIAALALGAAAIGGCKKSLENTPESVADAFVEAYFQRMDQRGALELTALGATKMLEIELKEVEELRKDGFEPGAVSVSVHRGEPKPREERIRIPYEIEIDNEGNKQVRQADIELSRIDGQWKVVRVGVSSKDSKTAM